MAISKIVPVNTGAIVAAVEQWLDDNIPQGQTVVVDSTLQVSGAAADAKVTGDRIAAVEADLPTISLVSSNKYRIHL